MAHKPICSIAGCDKPADTFKRGLCNEHDRRVKLYGDPNHGRKLAPRGAGMALLRDLVANERQECVYWPYHRIGGVANYGGVFFRGKNMVASRAACILLNGDPPSDTHQAAHNCGHGREGCVNPHHTRWATPVENMADMVEHGTRRRGKQIFTCKLTPEQVIQIRQEMSSGARQVATAEKYGISRRNVRAIASGETWQHLL